MGLCLRCGCLFNDEDYHICDEADVPEKGKPIRKGDKKEVV